MEDNYKKKVDITIYKKMSFIMNALENGWSVKKDDNKYIFSKKHENRKEVFKEDYLIGFLEDNIGLEHGDIKQKAY
jgi:hypothetical protein